MNFGVGSKGWIIMKFFTRRGGSCRTAGVRGGPGALGRCCRRGGCGSSGRRAPALGGCCRHPACGRRAGQGAPHEAFVSGRGCGGERAPPEGVGQGGFLPTEPLARCCPHRCLARVRRGPRPALLRLPSPAQMGCLKAFQMEFWSCASS